MCSSRLGICISPAPVVVKVSGDGCPAASSKHGLAACVEVLSHMRRDGGIARMGQQSLDSWTRSSSANTVNVYLWEHLLSLTD